MSNLEKLTRVEFMRAMNASPLRGWIITTAECQLLREKSGLGTGKYANIDLYYLIGWFLQQLPKVPLRLPSVPLPAPSLPAAPFPADPAAAAAPAPKKKRAAAAELDPGTYAAHKEKAAERQEEASRKGREIGEIPAVVDPDRRERARENFRLFCEYYFPHLFILAWSEDHLKVIAKIEEAVLRGGLFAMAMPRGSGKSTLAECACLWGMLYGHQSFTALIGAGEEASIESLESLKIELECNDFLFEDFPEVCYPIHCLEGISNRCRGQLHNGRRTRIGWTEKEIVLPTVEGSKASGGVIRVAGITGRIRGMKFKSETRAIRPTLVIVDDPQTDESARSGSQCETRERVLSGAILGLAGPGKKIAGIMPCTVIHPQDMADNILNRDKHPEWNGERTKLLYQFPANMKLWNKYGEIRGDSLRAGNGGKEATAFYAENRAEMDAGAVVAWKDRFEPDELSAVQNAMNIFLRDEESFFSEYQNEPIDHSAAAEDILTAEQIAGKLSHSRRFLVPVSATRLTAFIDVQGQVLFYVVVAWEDNFTGYVIDYGTYPDQQQQYYTLRGARNTLERVFKGHGFEARIYAGLATLTEMILGNEWKRQDQSTSKIEKCVIDANWGESTDTVYKFCRESVHSSILTPSHGRFVGSNGRPMAEWDHKPGDRVGLNWKVPLPKSRAIRHLIYDTNFWKSFVFARLAAVPGSPGCLSLYGDNPAVHRMFADHLTSEYRTVKVTRGREIDEWKEKPGRPDNHFFDCIVGATVAASVLGVAITTGTPEGSKPKEPRKKKSITEMQAAAIARREARAAAGGANLANHPNMNPNNYM